MEANRYFQICQTIIKKNEEQEEEIENDDDNDDGNEDEEKEKFDRQNFFFQNEWGMSYEVNVLCSRSWYSYFRNQSRSKSFAKSWGFYTRKRRIRKR